MIYLKLPGNGDQAAHGKEYGNLACPAVEYGFKLSPDKHKSFWYYVSLFSFVAVVWTNLHNIFEISINCDQFLCNIRRTYLMNNEVTKGYCISMSDWECGVIIFALYEKLRVRLKSI